MEQSIFNTTTCKCKVLVMAYIVFLCASCNEFTKSDLAQSVQNFNESLPQQQAEGLEFTSLTYDKVLDQIVFRFTFDENIYDAEEILAAFEEDRDLMKNQMVPYIREGAKKLQLNGTAEKFVYGFTTSKKTFEMYFSADEIDQIINSN